MLGLSPTLWPVVDTLTLLTVRGDAGGAKDLPGLAGLAGLNCMGLPGGSGGSITEPGRMAEWSLNKMQNEDTNRGITIISFW